MTNLEKAKRDYPVGTKFRDEYGNERTVSHDDHLEFGFKGVILCDRTPKEEWNLPGKTSCPYIYKDGWWAPIISKPVESKIEPDRGEDFTQGGAIDFESANSDYVDTGASFNATTAVDYYNSYSVEVIDMMERVFGKEKLKIFCELNAFKYRMRAGLKTEGDLEKEKYYLDKMRELS